MPMQPVPHTTPVGADARLFASPPHACAPPRMCGVLHSWFIGISRLWDNRHHTADIVGGFLLAVMLSTFTVIKVTWQYVGPGFTSATVTCCARTAAAFDHI